MFTKQFTIFFLLVTTFLGAISIVAQLAVRESTTTYDTDGVVERIIDITFTAENKISEQENAIENWVVEVEGELEDVLADQEAMCEFIDQVIGGH